MGDDKVKMEAMEILGMFQVLPRLVVFDLDYTLWPFYCECLSKQQMPSLYPHGKDILYALKDKGVNIAIASRSPTPDIANAFLDKLGLSLLFVAKLQEIFSSWTHKTEHFQKINRRTGVPYKEMLFFDDEDRNIEAVSKMGVTSILMDDGVNLEALRQGLSEFAQNLSPGKKNKENLLTDSSQNVLLLVERHIHLYDSYKTAGHDSFVRVEIQKLAQLLSMYYDDNMDDTQDLNIPFDVTYVQDIPQQRYGAMDCGLYLLAFAEYLSDFSVETIDAEVSSY
ncbi:hypothetical protein RDI58_024591 [Solanum bulbocastanum]|uniref:Ubiquitin-like protease family profile domain-containing protein n=1 Tax=Solanum bulbocastanum TaxID=147425 RepID=A0AAN8SXY1_SOLBU